MLLSTNASNFVEGVDKAFYFILGVSFLFLIGLTIVMIYFIYRYNNKRHPKAVQIEGSTTLEIIWTVVPTILVLLMFYFGWMGFKPMKEKAPEDSFKVKAIARMWSFAFEYENGKVTDKLFVPKDKPVEVELIAQDVIHSFYVPAFRIKEDMVPAQEKFVWFIPGQEGSFDLFCAEYCGLRHSYMITTVEVLEEDDFLAWYGDTVKIRPFMEVDELMAGQEVLRRNACISCHSLDGSRLVGPTFKGLYGNKRVVITAGEEREIIADDAYIKKSVWDSDADLVIGYNKGLMMNYQELVSEKEIEDVIAYIKSLNEE
jgi:cytochrome c oxidase subunit II